MPPVAAPALRRRADRATASLDRVTPLARITEDQRRRARDAEATRLMARFRDLRDERDFEALYALTEADVASWIRSLLRQGPAHLDAQEILQDTFVNVYRYPRSFRDESFASFRVWVRTISGNLIRRARSRAHPGTGDFADSPEPADRANRPDEQADFLESVRDLSAAWALFLTVYRESWSRLGERDRRALELVELEGKTHAQASAVLGVRPANMKMIVFRSRKRLVATIRTRLRPK